MKFYLKLLFIIFPWLGLVAQNEYPKDYFGSPVDFPIALAGNFGEIRGGHFHAGIDIKTQQVEGKPILAAADGYISRIKISLYGYGKAIYVRHPNGYTTVYAHLQKFNDEINALVKQAQYNQKTFTVELFPEANQLQVKKGEIIALSGNTGGSGGPHLHFEIRDTRNETPLNPLLFGFNVKDTKPPLLKTLGVYPLNEVSWVDGQNEPKYFAITKTGNDFSVNQNKPIEVSGKIGFGIETNDYLDAAPNRCGVYSILLTKNNVPVYQHEMEKIPFDETRFINTHVDFFAWNKLNKRVQRNYLQSNNQLSIYKNLLNKGQLFFLNDTIFQMDYLVLDAYKNASTLGFQVKSSTNPINFKRPESDSLLFKTFEDNSFNTNNFSVFVPKGTLYEDFYFNFSEQKPIPKAISKVYNIHNLYTPLQGYMYVTLPLDSAFFGKSSKVLAVSLDEKLKVISGEGGVFEEGKIKFKTRSFGPYTLMIDTTAPSIKPINIYPEKNMQTENLVKFKIGDDLSGINSYNGYINNNWELFEFDQKTGILSFEFDEKFNQKITNDIEIIITDERNNRAIYTTTFVR